MYDLYIFKIKDIFSRVKVKFDSLGKEYSSNFVNEFQQILNNEIGKINSSVDTSVPNYIHATNVITVFYLFKKYNII
jgi:hypothetical protein